MKPALQILHKEVPTVLPGHFQTILNQKTLQNINHLFKVRLSVCLFDETGPKILRDILVQLRVGQVRRVDVEDSVGFLLETVFGGEGEVLEPLLLGKVVGESEEVTVEDEGTQF
jgi:hypothetical protein